MLPLTLAAYERVTGVLLSSPSISEPDSLMFAIDPAVAHPTVAAWLNTPTSAPVLFYARCGAVPTLESWDIGAQASATRPAFLDLSMGCSTQWFVIAVNVGGLRPSAGAPAAFDLRIGAATAGREWSDIRVGIEYPVTTGAEEQYIRNAVREAAWRFYGATGGSHLVRSFVFDTTPGCRDVTICWRNRPVFAGCTDGDAITAGGGTLGTVHVCIDTSSAVRPNPRGDAALLAHEFGHLFTGTSVLNWLGDEYWESSGLTPICGLSGQLILRCSHSLMTVGANPRITSLCNARTHDSTVEVLRQTPDGLSRIGMAAGDRTLAECSDGALYSGDPYGIAAWDQLNGSGAAMRHPPWVADNFDFVLFANSSVSQVGRTR